MTPSSFRVWLLAAGMLFGGGASARIQSQTVESIPASRVRLLSVSDSVAVDAALDSLVQPFRRQLDGKINEVIGHAAAEIVKAKPEGPLGNLVSDAMLQAVEGRADFAMTNTGGLRVPIASGDITVGDVFEVMPFENALVILTMRGTLVDSLAQAFAGAGGEPVAGIQFAIVEGKATDIKVAGQPLRSNATYRMVTNDYVADGGDNFGVLKFAHERTNTGILMRDAIIQHIRDLGTIHPAIEGRITKP